MPIDSISSFYSNSPAITRDENISTPAEKSIWGADGFTFGDILDIINPFQQLPIISTIYRAVTGDKISPASRMAGGALLGGPIGFLVSALNAGVEAATGDDIGEHMIALIDEKRPADIQMADVAKRYSKTHNLA